LNEVVSSGPNLIGAVGIYRNVHNTWYANLNEPLNLPRWFQLYPSLNDAVSITTLD